MSSWFRPLTLNEVGQQNSELFWLCQNDWFPKDAVVMMSDKGSMEKRLIKFVVEHINRFVRREVPEGVTYCLTLDGHSSREGWEWLKYAQSIDCVIVQGPANTSHFLQPCDQFVNKAFKKSVRRVRDKMCGEGKVDTRCIRINLMLGLIGFTSITTHNIFQSFGCIGLWPMDYRFLERFEPKSERPSKIAERFQSSTSVGSRLPTVVKRQADAAVFGQVKKIIEKESSASKGLQGIEMLVRKHETVNTILMNAGARKRTTAPHPDNPDCQPKNSVLYQGTPACYMTFGGCIEKQREKERLEQAEEAAKLAAREMREKEKLVQQEKKAVAHAERQRLKLQRTKDREAAKQAKICRKRAIEAKGDACASKRSRGIKKKQASASESSAASALVDLREQKI